MIRETTEIPAPLLAQIAAQCARPFPPLFAPLGAVMQKRFGMALEAIILYGSCLRGVTAEDGVVDLYVLVSDYRAAYAEYPLRFLNRLLPPNVYYAEVEGKSGPIRVKYAVISMDDFAAGTSRWFHPYLWARFAQPVRLMYTAGEAARATVHEALARAVLTFLKNVLPVMESAEFSIESVWTTGLTRTYQAELRPERDAQAGTLVQRDRDDYSRLTQGALPALSHLVEPLADGRLRCTAGVAWSRRLRRFWAVRRLQGRVLSVLRFIKAAFTFSGGIDYAAWKIERHSGLHIDITPELRRRPILGGCRILWKLLKTGALH